MRAYIGALAVVATLAFVPTANAQNRTFGDFDCTDDCSGHAAGYNWAEKHSIDDEPDCPDGNSQSFHEGCIAYGHRDATMILVAYRHGLRASEVCGLRWDQVELDSGRLHVRRAKGGIDNVHPLAGKEIRALRQLRRENTASRYVFVTERGGPATTAGFLKMVARTGEAAKLPFPVHPHMLRHSTGYKLANDGHDTRALQHDMGHKGSCTR